MRHTLQKLEQRIGRLVRQHEGPLTEELALVDGPEQLGKVPQRLAPSTTADLICGYCSTGCSLRAHLRDGAAVNLTASPDYPVNTGMACPKGWEALAPLDALDRATTPLLRGRDGRLAPCNWDTALHAFVDRFKRVQAEHGPEAAAFLGTGQITTEELAYLGALGKFGMGMLHGDGNTRQCMATAVAAYKQSFGFDAPPYTYADFESSDVIVLVGSNLCVAHPIMWQRIARNPNSPRVVVIDPRRTETAVAATHHYAPHPKSDLTLLYGVAKQLIEQGWIDEAYIAAHTSEFAAFREHVQPFTPERVAAETGLDPTALLELTQMIAAGERVSFWWTMGVNQSYEGTRVAQAIINLALMTGNMGRSGTGANSITGQCNAMGSRMFSNTSSLFCGRDFTSARDRADVARILELPVERIPDRNGWAYDQIVEGIAAGKIKALWVVATNSAHSWISQRQFRSVLEELDVLVVQDLYPTTETAELADIVLPAAGWGEKTGSFINSERRVGRLQAVRTPPGEALPDFEIFRRVAEYWGCADDFASWRTPADVFESMRELSRGRPNDITGIRDYKMLSARGGIQWPFPAGNEDDATERRLFEDGKYHHPDGRATFIFDEPRPPPEAPNGEYPLLLLTGRGSSAQWHTQTRTGKSSVLRKLYPQEAYVEINPADAAKAGVRALETVVVESRRGQLRARAQVTQAVRPGQVFMPMHYADTNRLTIASFDPHSRQPSYKAAAVRVRPLQHWEEE